MKVSKLKMKPVRLVSAGKRDMRTQFGALCWRPRKTGFEVLLITTRRTGRWAIPKGWPMDGLTPVEAAREEAWEEAGVRGKTSDLCLGVFTYTKILDDGNEDSLPCMVAVFPMKVTATADTWPESDARKRKWFTPKKAALRIREPELQRILLTFNPARLAA